MKTVRRTAICCTFCLLLSACGQNAVERAIEEQTNGEADVDFDGETMQIETDEGSMEIGSQTLPDAWPLDVPVYPDATIMASYTTNMQEEQAATMLNLATKDAPTAVQAFYDRELKANSWLIESQGSFGTMTMISAKKESRSLTLQIMVNEEEGKTMVTLAVAADE
jgi:uncharacterized protein (DUF2344 family)